MKPAEIKKVAETYDLDTLRQAEEDITEEKGLSIEVGGEDEGEQLTHILAAIWIREQMYKNGTDVKTELRNYTQRVRTSIN